MADIAVKGTAFSSDAVAGDVYNRTDILGGLWFEYDGTSWISEPLAFTRWIENQSATAINRTRLPTNGYNIYIPGNVATTTYVATTNDATHNWTVTVAVTDTVFANDVTIHTFNTSADTANAYTAHDDVADSTKPAVGAGVDITMTKNNSPGNAFCWVSFLYRIIAT